MEWLGNPELHFVLVVLGMAIIGLGGYAYYHGRLSRSELAFVLLGAVAWIAYAIEGAAAFLSLTRAVSSLLAGVAGLSFVGLFLYWAYSREGEASE